MANLTNLVWEHKQAQAAKEKKKRRRKKKVSTLMPVAELGMCLGTGFRPVLPCNEYSLTTLMEDLDDFTVNTADIDELMKHIRQHIGDGQNVYSIPISTV